MAVGYLNERTKKIIEMILRQNQSDKLGIKDIAAELAVSTRTVYNELEKAGDWLKAQKLPVFNINRGKLTAYTDEQRKEISDALDGGNPSEDYIFTPTERIKIIVCQIIVSDIPIYIEDLMNTCQVSRNTIFADLQAVISQLYTYQLELLYEKKKGYWISGDPIRKRALFFLFFNMLEPLLTADKLTFVHRDAIDHYMDRIEQIENELQVSYVKNDMLALAAMIPSMEKGSDRLYFSDVSIQKVQQSKEYELVEKYFPQLSENERAYLTLHFLGGRLEDYSRMPQGDTDESLQEIVRNLVAEFERRACVVFGKKDDLIANLYRHISSSIYRYRFGIQIGNLMAEDIQREYPYIFDTVREAVRYLEQQIKVQISDSEVAYLALHFGAHMEYARHDEKQIRILVVCMNGVATGNMISHELKRILPQVNIVGVVAASRLKNPQAVCDIIVSSVKISAAVPVIVVNPILNDFDRKNILSHPLIKNRYSFVDMDALFRLIKKYVPAEKHIKLRHELGEFFLKNNEDGQTLLKPDMWSLTDFLTEDRIVFLNEDGSVRGQEQDGKKYSCAWEAALYNTAAPLIKRESIDEEYVKCIIDRLGEAGPYMFVTNDLILAHARPENGVKHLDISIGIASKGILFECEKRARIVFLLVVEDQQKHMGILKDIRKVLAKPYQVDKLTEQEDAGAVCELLWNELAEARQK